MTGVSTYEEMERAWAVWVQVLVEGAWVAFDLDLEGTACPIALDSEGSACPTALDWERHACPFAIEVIA
jgi:hypothetical protein